MQLVDRVEKRRFVGREFLLWLWFESEAFEATLSTKEHGTFGLWIEKHLVLSLGKEGTRIKGTYPAGSREAKEALALGKLPEAAGLHLSWDDREITFTLKADRLALSQLSLPTVLGKPADEGPALLAPRAPPRSAKRTTEAEDRESASDERHESFYERMRLTRETEGLVEALYRDFLALRLGSVWPETMVAMLAAWVRGDSPIDSEAYRKIREDALAPRARSRSTRPVATKAGRPKAPMKRMKR